MIKAKPRIAKGFLKGNSEHSEAEAKESLAD